MQVDTEVSFTVYLPEAKAYALAELCKRIGWKEAVSNATCDEEARLMLGSMESVRAALALAGVSVR